ncbi:membrane-associated kinase regulator 2 [Hirschfeldia incana]|nr:membrane-associated kinase regulator 2 [Hirschfeldia incana]
MEAFSLLNYWKNNGVPSGHSFLPPQSSDSSCRYPGEATTIVTSVTETEEEDAEDDDEGPFFDLKFAVPVEEEEESEERDEASDVGVGGDSDGCEYKFTLSSSCSGGEDGEVVDQQDLIVSPSGDVYLKGQIVEEEEVEAPSTGTEQTCSVKAPAAQLSASILKSATKLRVFMLGTKKSKLLQAKPKDPPPPPPLQPPSQESQQPKSTVTVSLKAEEVVPIVSLFTRDNSSRNSSSSSSSPCTKRQNGSEAVVSEENRFVMMQKYLKKVKPLYIRVSRRYNEKLKQHSGGPLSLDSSTAPTTKSEESPVKKAHKPGNININIPAGFKVVRKHLGKSRSSSSTTTVPPPAATVTTPSESRRRDDSLLQQQDSIQSAILHCKRSFNSSRDKDPSVLPRSVSDSSSYDK